MTARRRPAPGASVEDARSEYAAVALAIFGAQAAHLRGMHPGEAWRCTTCHWLGLVIEAASIVFDLEAAEASLERLRGSVAW